MRKSEDKKKWVRKIENQLSEFPVGIKSLRGFGTGPLFGSIQFPGQGSVQENIRVKWEDKNKKKLNISVQLL